MDEPRMITVGELIEALKAYPADTEITSGATLEATSLDFYRVKNRGPNLVQIELNERFD